MDGVLCVTCAYNSPVVGTSGVDRLPQRLWTKRKSIVNTLFPVDQFQGPYNSGKGTRDPQLYTEVYGCVQVRNIWRYVSM
jgi:hypothetical protein